MHVTVMTLDDGSWLEIEEQIEEQLAQAKKQGVKVKDFQVFSHNGILHLLLKHKKRHNTMLE